MTWCNKAAGIAFAVGSAVLLFGMSAAAAATSDDASLKNRIEARLQDAHFHQPAQVQVTVENGKAVLSGHVPSVEDLWTVARAAHKETKQVENNVTVRPVKEVSDAALGKAIEKAVLRYPYYNVFDAVGFSVDNGQVVLTGSVYQPWHKGDIDARVAEIVGVRGLQSHIKVQPLSPFDQKVRLATYRAIYGSAVFSRLAIDPDPPIRIVVTDGHITLKGTVDSGADKQLLTILASQVPGFGPVTNDVRVERVKPKVATATARASVVV
jgi:hyperosmotically inducible protein